MQKNKVENLLYFFCLFKHYTYYLFLPKLKRFHHYSRIFHFHHYQHILFL